MANINTAFVQDVFDLPQAERETNVIHNGKFDDFWTGFEVFEVIDFGHKSENITKSPKIVF